VGARKYSSSKDAKGKNKRLSAFPASSSFYSSASFRGSLSARSGRCAAAEQVSARFARRL